MDYLGGKVDVICLGCEFFPRNCRGFWLDPNGDCVDFKRQTVGGSIMTDKKQERGDDEKV